MISDTSRPRFPYLLVLLVALVIADGLMTEFLVAYRLGWEANPLLSGFLKSGNLTVFKTVGASVAALILWDVHRRHPSLALASTLVFVVAYMAIIYWNIVSFIIAS